MEIVQKILVPVDFSSLSAGWLEYAAMLAQQTGAQLIVLRVLDPREQESSRDGSPIFRDGPAPRASKSARRTLDRRLKDRSLDLFTFIQEVLGRNPAVRLDRQVREGNLVREILATAKGEGIDLIVLGIRKESFLSYLASLVTYTKLIWLYPGSVLLTPPVAAPPDNKPKRFRRRREPLPKLFPAWVYSFTGHTEKEIPGLTNTVRT